MAEQQGSRRLQQQPQTLVRSQPSDQPSTSQSGQSRISSMQQTLQPHPQQSQHILMPVIKNVIDELTTVIKAEVGSVQTEQAKFSKMMKKLSDDSFSIENSPFKAELNRQIATLFCLNLKRRPGSAEISVSILTRLAEEFTKCATQYQDRIAKVMGSEAENHLKVQKAKRYFTKRLSALRSEERRRVFGVAPCTNYNQLCTREFAEKFLHSQKVKMVYLPIYCKHLAVLRTFARSVPNAKDNTYKKFEIWIRDNSTGEPPVLNIEAIAAADEQYEYSIPTTIPEISSPVPLYMPSPTD